MHLYGTSSGGKTAAIKAAFVDLGRPRQNLINFYTTKVALSAPLPCTAICRWASMRNRSLADQQGMVDALVYILGSGQSKGQRQQDRRPAAQNQLEINRAHLPERTLTSSNASTGA